MTVLAAALAAILAAEPAPSAPAGGDRPDAEWGTGPAEPSRPAPPAAPPALPPMPHSVDHGQVARPTPDFTLAAGWGANGLMGLSSTGVEVTFEAGLPSAAPSRAVMLVTGDLFVGETSAALPVRSLALGAEIWWSASRVRMGGGVGSGFVGYRRATSGEWEFNATAGVRAGIEVAVLRLGAHDVVLGAHGAASLGPWYSGYLTAGWRFRTGAP